MSRDEPRADGEHVEPTIRRRAAMALLGAGTVAGLAGRGAATDGGAEGSPVPWQRDRDASGHDLLDLGALEATDVTVGSDPIARPLISEEPRRLHVPGDYDTVQAAVNQIPLVVRHALTIELAPGSYDEDVVVPAFLKTQQVAMESEGGYVNLLGDESDPGAVRLGSLYAAGATGRLPLAVLGLTFTRDNPYDNEATALAFYGGGEYYVRSVNVGDGTDGAIGNGVLAYAADVHVDQVDFGDGNVREHGYTVKHGGELMEQKIRDPTSTGHVGGYAYDPEEGHIFFRSEQSDLTGDAGRVKDDGAINGFALDTENRVLHNVAELAGASAEADLLLEQGSNSGVPGDLSTAEFDSLGQSFTVDGSVSRIRAFTATYTEPDSKATFTLYEGSPADGDLSMVASERVDPLPDNDYVSLDLGTSSGGTYYLEMTDADGRASWWWHDVDDGLLADVGGSAFVNRNDREHTNYVFQVFG